MYRGLRRYHPDFRWTLTLLVAVLYCMLIPVNVEAAQCAPTPCPPGINFTDIDDVPQTYTDHEAEFFRVNAAEDGLEYYKAMLGSATVFGNTDLTSMVEDVWIKPNGTFSLVVGTTSEFVLSGTDLGFCFTSAGVIDEVFLGDLFSSLSRPAGGAEATYEIGVALNNGSVPDCTTDVLASTIHMRDLEANDNGSLSYLCVIQLDDGDCLQVCIRNTTDGEDVVYAAGNLRFSRH